ncbi:TetR/AcrR family transcriptional regulator [Neptunicella marina]|uniref:TetR/AcrR family transcriptional regulator n=1 Tax=Neptunicella marina TaxID=2125989 RepID=A0A8J6IVA5_9ALTE|nr:TetR/AcrR family transcriptional regulator [Neptunicella marina]MBC3766256.1 TetR/AcrR family transcriptional regulator [Neptunicella marina]
MKYDRTQAVENAKEVFWQLGFQGSKMRDLQLRMNMRPGSIYAGFGSKEGLFKEALTQYVQEFQLAIQEFVDSSDSPLQGLKRFFESQIIDGDDFSKKPLCLLVKTVTELEESQPELAHYAQCGLQSIAETFSECLNQCKECGELRTDANPARLAKWLQMQLMGLRLYAKNKPQRQEVLDMIDDIFSHLN